MHTNKGPRTDFAQDGGGLVHAGMVIGRVLASPLRWLTAIHHSDEEVREQAALLNLILLVPLLGSLFFGLSPGPEASNLTVRLLVIFFPVILCPLVIIRSKQGRVWEAATLFTVGYAIRILLIALTENIGSRTPGALVNLMASLVISLLAVVTILNMQAIILAAAVNIVVSLIMAVVWWPAFADAPQPQSFARLVFPTIIVHLFTMMAELLFVRNENRRRAKLAEQINLLKVILDNIPVGVAVFDRLDFKPLYKNKLATDLAGDFADEVQNRIERKISLFNEPTIQQPVDPAIRMSERKPWEVVGRSGKVYEPDGYITLTDQGRTWDIQEKAIPIKNSRQEVTQVVYSAVDVSKYQSLLSQMHRLIIEQKGLSQDLREQDKARLQVMAVFGHELRTPINTIISRLEMMLADYKDLSPDAVQQDLRTVAGAAQDVRYLANNLLEAANVSTRQQTWHPERFDLRTIVDDIALNMEVLIHKKGLRLERLYPAEAILVNADSRHVRQIVYNLLANAYKYTNEGTITIQIERTSHEARLSVIDTGIGIPPDKLEMIFRRFEQLQREGTGRESGLGLGLAIARSLVTMQGGQLWVESAVNHGSRFSFSLPLALPEEDPLPGAATPTKLGNFGPL
jgi:signal transduction histidine kinase